MIPGFKLMRKLAIGFAILLLLFFGANLIVQRIAEHKIGDAVASKFGLKERPAVHIGGFPILLHVLQRNVPSIGVTAHDVVRNDLAIETVTLTLDSITAKGSFTGGGPLSVNVGGGRASAIVEQQAVNDFIRKRGVDLTMRFGEAKTSVSGSGTFAGARHRVSASGRLHIEGTSLRFDPTPSSIRVDGQPPNELFRAEAERRTTFSVQLPALPYDIRLTTLQTHEGKVEFGATMKARSFALR